MATNINIKQMNWSDYLAGNRPKNSLIYIQDKNFYIQCTSDNYSQLSLGQYFVVYDPNNWVKDNLFNAMPGLYLILASLDAVVGKLYYHDGTKKWIAVSGSGGGGSGTGSVNSIMINGQYFTPDENGNIEITKQLAELYSTQQEASNAYEQSTPGANGYIGGIVDGGGW